MHFLTIGLTLSLNAEMQLSSLDDKVKERKTIPG